MKSKRLNPSGPATYALVFDKGDEVIANLTESARRSHLNGSHFTAAGAFQKPTLGYFDRDRKEYKKIPVDEQVEVLSLIGDVAAKEGGEHKVHVHVVVGKADGTAHGGQILEATVWPTLEATLTEEPAHLQRRHDAQTGLTLIAIVD